MLNNLLQQLQKYDMLRPGERVYCAVSGGADSMALLWGMYLLREKLGISLAAAHFNHHLRGEESDREEAFVRAFCRQYEIDLTVSSGDVVAGEKGLEAAAREARYAFFDTLSGKIATAHTADDNAETVLMHLIRGTGLKGLGGIAPVRRNLIRPMLTVTRQQVLAFLGEYHVPHVEDSSNAEDTFLRNRLRHYVMPLLKRENPSLMENLSQMAMDLREDEQQLEKMAEFDALPAVSQLRELPTAVRRRMLVRFLKEQGVREPEKSHVALAECLVYSEKPSACGGFPGNVFIRRNYDRLEVMKEEVSMVRRSVPVDGTIDLPEIGLRIRCLPAKEIVNTDTVFTVHCGAQLQVRSRQTGDRIRLSGGSKQVKKLFIDRKIPANMRQQIPVLADEMGLVGVYGIGADMDRRANCLPATQIRFEKINSSEML